MDSFPSRFDRKVAGEIAAAEVGYFNTTRRLKAELDGVASPCMMGKRGLRAGFTGLDRLHDCMLWRGVAVLLHCMLAALLHHHDLHHTQLGHQSGHACSLTMRCLLCALPGGPCCKLVGNGTDR